MLLAREITYFVIAAVSISLVLATWENHPQADKMLRDVPRFETHFLVLMT